MEKGTIILIVNLVFALFLVLGFLGGFVKGIKKSGLRLGLFVVGIIISAIISPYISKMIMQINVTYQGQMMSLSDVILSMINSSEQVAEMTAASPTLKTFIENVPLMVGNVVTFVILCYIISLITWIIYKIIASACFKSDKSYKQENVKAPKKYRLLGGAVGIVQGLILAFLTFLPISGITNIINDVSAQSEAVQAETTETQTELSPSAKLINDILPKEVRVYFDAYSQSMVSKVSGVFGTDNAVFNAVSSVSVNNVKISLRDEVINLAKVYDNVAFLLDIDFSNIEVIKTLDYDKLIGAIDYIFNSNILKTVLPELSDFAFSKILESEQIVNNQNYKDLVETVQKVLKEDQGVVNNLKNDLIAILNTAKTLASSNILEYIPFDGSEITTENVSNILTILSNDNKAVFDDIIENIFNSKILNRGVIFALNLGLDYVETMLEDLTQNDNLNIGRIDIKNTDLNLKKAEVKSFSSSLINILNKMITVDYEAIENDYRLIFDMELPYIATNVGSMMSAVQNMTVFNSTNIYDNVIDALKNTSYNNYIDFEVLKNDNIWVNEMSILSDVITKVQQSNVVSYVDKNGQSYTVSNGNITKILNNLTELNEVNGQNKTKIRQIIEPLYTSQALKKLINVGLTNLNDIINDLGKKIGNDVVLGEMNFDNLYQEKEKENLLSFVDNVAFYVKTLDTDKVINDPFITILNSNLAQLGSCMDSLKGTSLFADVTVDNNVQKGIYTNLIEALENTKFSDYVNFACFKEENFSFNSEFSAIEVMVRNLLDKKINDKEQEYSLIDYIINVGNWNVIFQQITTDDLTNVFTPLMKNKIFQPIGTMVVNKINEQLKNVVGEYGGAITTVIESLSEEEIGEVINVLGSVSGIINDITAEDFTISKITKGDNSDKLADLLNNLQENANNNGVFKQSYEALIEFAENDSEIGQFITEGISEYPQGEINWNELISNIKNRG